ncbi:head decoration protein [Lysinibacillus irui]|uniref:head decoration protein n=1 Tax=Lysinibacillus irui TaxID=2998077 RepID=UPI002AD20C54|nr:head decoration protein [Lysinibacillus irui]MEA0565320.1 head decoration protein [Lysinibacillus irui]
MKLNGQVGTYEPNNLIYDTSFPLQTGSAKLKAGQGLLLQGTIIGKDNAGEYVVASTTATTPIVADAILADDIDTGSEPGISVFAETYISGTFNSDALLTDGTDKVSVHYDVLRTKGIYLKNSI